MDGATGDMAAAVEAAFSAASPAATTDSSQTTPESASTTSAESGTAVTTPQSSEPEPGPVPYARFKEVNEAANLTKKELEQLGWAKGIDAAHSKELVNFYQRLRSSPDPASVFLEELDHLRSTRPESAASLRSWAARVLGTRASSQEVDPDPEPAADIQLEDGRAVYSAGQLAKAIEWRERRFESRMDEKLKPLQQSAHQTEADKIFAQKSAEAQQYATQTISEMRQKPYFSDHEKDIHAAMKADDALSLNEAYAKVLIEKVMPKLNQATASTLQQKVRASSANPSRPSGATPPPPADFREALEQLSPEVLARMG